MRVRVVRVAMIQPPPDGAAGLRPHPAAPGRGAPAGLLQGGGERAVITRDFAVGAVLPIDDPARVAGGRQVQRGREIEVRQPDRPAVRPRF
ncbi:hypothetical protein MASR1M32_38550 [Rhodobacter sp.]